MEYQEIMAKMGEIFMLILNFTKTWIYSLLMCQEEMEAMDKTGEMV